MILIYIFIFVLGAIFGSFLSAYTYRVVAGKSVIGGRSYCPKCKKKISWYDNIPILSFFLLKGKCRNCNKKISFRYPVLEISTGLLFLGTLLKALDCGHSPISIFPDSGLICSWVNINFIFGYILILILILILTSIFIIDLEHMIIPDSIIFPSLMFFYIFYAIEFSQNLFIFLFAGFSAALFLLFLHLVTLGRGMGLGDVKFAILGGFLLGPRMTVVWLFLSFILGALIGIFLLAFKKAKIGKQIPFGPYLAISFLIVLFFGSDLYRSLNIPF